MKTLLLVLILVLAGPAAGQEKYPSRPVDFIVTWGTGGGAESCSASWAPSRSATTWPTCG